MLGISDAPNQATPRLICDVWRIILVVLLVVVVSCAISVIVWIWKDGQATAHRLEATLADLVAMTADRDKLFNSVSELESNLTVLKEELVATQIAVAEYKVRVEALTNFREQLNMFNRLHTNSKEGEELKYIEQFFMDVAEGANIATQYFTKEAEQARLIQTKANLKMLHGAVNMFKLDTGRYPSEEKGLIELVERPADVKYWQSGGYLETTEVPRDAWRNEFVYQRNPRNGRPFVIISYGADGREGGEGLNADLLSFEVN